MAAAAAIRNSDAAAAAVFIGIHVI